MSVANASAFNGASGAVASSMGTFLLSPGRSTLPRISNAGLSIGVKGLEWSDREYRELTS